MRLAIIATSPYTQSGTLTELSEVPAQVDLFAQRLGDPDADFVVSMLPADRSLPAALENLVASLRAPADEILFLFAGYVVVGDKGIPGLLLDGERLSTLSLRRVRRLLSEHAETSLVVLDTVTALSSWEPSDLVRLCDATIRGEQEDVGLHLLAANRPEPDGLSPLLNLLVLMLDWYASDDGLFPDSLFASMQREEAMFSQIPYVELFGSSLPFRLLLPRAPISVVPSLPPPPPPGQGARARAEAFAKAGNWDDALEEYRLALTYEAPSAPLFAKVGEALEQVGKTREAEQYYQAALELDPSSPAALSNAATLREKAGDNAGAVALLERVAAQAPEDAALGFRLGHLLEARKDPLRALDHLTRALRLEPGRADGYRAAMRLFDAVQDVDGRWNAACALEVLGESDVNDSLLAAAHRTEGLLPVKEGLTEDHWMRRLLSPERDALIDEVFGALGGALVELGLETATRKRRARTHAPETLVDVAKNTTTLIRMLTWSSRLLGVPVPKVHILPDLPGGFVVPPTKEPTLLVSKSLGSGLGMPELAFLWARQLTFLRPEYGALRFFPTAPELHALLLATLSMSRAEKVPPKKLEGDGRLFARGLRRHLRPDALARIDDAGAEFPLAEANARIRRWVTAAESAALRAGLLACGSLEIAADLSRRFPIAGSADGAQKLAEGPGAKVPRPDVLQLLAYSVSNEYGILRARLGVKLS